MSGTLYIVATPIGNLGDLTPRAAETFAKADFIAAEDTRVTLKLLNHLGLKKPMVSYYEHNLKERGGYILDRIEAGESCALCSDAGMPAVSDPGEVIVRDAHARGIPVVPVPAASAAVTALCVSGQPTGRFVFEGFLPTNRRQKKERLAALQNEERTVIFYEAPHKLPTTLQDLEQAFGPERSLTICRELTKLHEEIRVTTVGDASAYYPAPGRVCAGDGRRTAMPCAGTDAGRRRRPGAKTDGRGPERHGGGKICRCAQCIFQERNLPPLPGVRRGLKGGKHMKLLVVSDVHGDLDALERAVDAEADADAVIFLGDGLREAENLQDMRPELKIYSVRGNCDYASFAPPDGLAAFGGVLFYYTHGNLYNVKNELDTLADAARARGADAALYGHTHCAGCEERSGVVLFNPGALSRVQGRGSYGVVMVENGAPRFEHRRV